MLLIQALWLARCFFKCCYEYDVLINKLINYCFYYLIVLVIIIGAKAFALAWLHYEFDYDVEIMQHLINN